MTDQNPQTSRHLPHAVVEVSPNGVILACTDTFSDLLHSDQATLVGTDLSASLGLARDVAPDLLRGIIAGGVGHCVVENALLGDQKTDLQVTAVPVRAFGRLRQITMILTAQEAVSSGDSDPGTDAETLVSMEEANLMLLEAKGKLDGVYRTQAVIEFDTQGNILTANDLFLSVMGYPFEEVQGQHHSMFATPEFARTQEYKDFWASLREGKFQQAEYHRLAKGGRSVWIQATYTPILDEDGQVIKVVKFATDVTDEKLKSADAAGKLSAINKAQAVIEFDMSGHILTANENFLGAMGYSLEEVQGQHHRMFVTEKEKDSDAYLAFWASLREGNYQQAEYKRIGKNGSEIWIQASYNPILNPNGEPIKVVKFATDVTEQKMLSASNQAQVDAISRSQAVIEFDVDGNIITANDNFLNTLGYTLDEVQGQHHRIFVDPQESKTPEYEQFWESLRNGEYQQAEYRRINKSGDDVWIQAVYNPIFDPDGKPIRVIKFATDITEEVAKRTERELLSLVANSTDNSVIITDSNRCIEYVNSGFERLTGYSANEAIGKTPAELLQGPLTDEATVQRVRQKLNCREPFYDEILNYTKSGLP